MFYFAYEQFLRKLIEFDLSFVYKTRFVSDLYGYKNKFLKNLWWRP